MWRSVFSFFVVGAGLVPALASPLRGRCRGAAHASAVTEGVKKRGVGPSRAPAPTAETDGFFVGAALRSPLCEAVRDREKDGRERCAPCLSLWVSFSPTVYAHDDPIILGNKCIKVFSATYRACVENMTWGIIIGVLVKFVKIYIVIVRHLSIILSRLFQSRQNLPLHPLALPRG